MHQTKAAPASLALRRSAGVRQIDSGRGRNSVGDTNKRRCFPYSPTMKESWATPAMAVHSAATALDIIGREDGGTLMPAIVKPSTCASTTGWAMTQTNQSRA